MPKTMLNGMEYLTAPARTEVLAELLQEHGIEKWAAVRMAEDIGERLTDWLFDEVGSLIDGTDEPTMSTLRSVLETDRCLYPGNVKIERTHA